MPPRGLQIGPQVAQTERKEPKRHPFVNPLALFWRSFSVLGTPWSTPRSFGGVSGCLRVSFRAVSSHYGGVLTVQTASCRVQEAISVVHTAKSNAQTAHCREQTANSSVKTAR